MDTKRVGLIGVGNIGTHFSKKLTEAGFPLTVFDLDEAKVQRAVDLGASAAESTVEVAEASDVILLSLPSSKPVEAVMDSLLPVLQTGQVVADTGTSRRETDVQYAKLCAEKGAALIDAPITWRSGGPTIMVGGEAQHFEQAREVLEAVSNKLQHVGPIGHGQALKYVNQMILAGQLAVWCESVEFAKSCGLDPELIAEHLEFPVPDVLFGDDFSGTGTLKLHYKDLGYILEAAHETGAHVPVSNVAHEAFKYADTTGDPLWGQPGIATYWRALRGEGE
jgi:3-hydroxyisobutyrate dehydrogenase-like beta-hydroxyacid dehydrogenase